MTTLNKKQLNKHLFQWSVKEIRQGQLWPVSVALTLIIAAIFALSALAERMEQVIVKQGKEALTADSVYRSSNPIPIELIQATETLQLDHSSMVRFSTMAFSDNAMKLVSVKSVDERYPLLGELKLSQAGKMVSRVAGNQLWLDERLFNQLEVEEGDTITLGDADFIISGRVVEEPGLSFNPFQQMPSAYIHQSDLEKTGAIQLGSRVRYSYFLTGSDAQLESIKEAVTLTPSDSWRDQNSESRTNEVFQRTEQYLSLTVAIVVIMAATTLVLTCQHYVSTRLKTIAMLKSLGASKGWIIRWLLIQAGILLLAASVLGCLLGIGLEYLLRLPLADLLPNPLPPYGVTPALLAISTSVLIAIPALGIPLSNLINVSAVNAMQPQQVVGNDKRFFLVLVPITALLVMFRDNLLVWLVLGGMMVLFAVLALISVAMTRVMARLPLNAEFKLALSRINRSSLSSGIQFGALALSLMLLAVMWLVRTDLLSDWQRTLPDDAPNAFALNIAPYEKDAYLNILDENSIERSDAYPIIRGRVATINQIDAKEYVGGEIDSDALSREINFTFSDAIPSYNTLLEGDWQPLGGVSVEAQVAKELGLELGDQLGFMINSQPVTARVDSIRHVEWRDMKPNFYFIFTPDVLEQIPATYLVSFRVQEQDDALLNDLSRQHPTVSLMDIRVMGAKIQELVSQIVWAITLLAGLSVIAGALLIFTLLRLSLGQRQNEIQLYRTLGASKKRVVRTIWAEYGVMGMVAGIIAVAGAELIVAAIMKWGFDLEIQLHYSLWIALPLLAFCTLGVVVNSLIKRLLIPINKAFS